jgi:hypothetical protein
LAIWSVCLNEPLLCWQNKFKFNNKKYIFLKSDRLGCICRLAELKRSKICSKILSQKPVLFNHSSHVEKGRHAFHSARRSPQQHFVKRLPDLEIFTLPRARPIKIFTAVINNVLWPVANFLKLFTAECYNKLERLSLASLSSLVLFAGTARSLP